MNRSRQLIRKAALTEDVFFPDPSGKFDPDDRKRKFDVFDTEAQRRFLFQGTYREVRRYVFKKRDKHPGVVVFANDTGEFVPELSLGGNSLLHKVFGRPEKRRKKAG